ncbi:hypothetical protein BD289DRAFT_415144 [Coniella lustricola]|uniref:Homeodomain-like protein n=1 Tax=Coniella lustricola TaxID=2025994 RepID=A0A2T2ZZ14_9PEZI|nr:hypothetical protein BD289DRAFT_415144 [Coniella lustricola]
MITSHDPELDNKRPLLWRDLAKHIPGRSNKDCRKRWWNSLAGSTSKGAWTPEEDRQLIEAVEKYGTNWTKVAAAVGTRCGDQCSGHWRHVLNPNINYCDWTEEEDEQLLNAVRVYGTNWSTIAAFHTPQRTTLALKNQYWKLRQRMQNTSKVSTTKSSTQTSSPKIEKATTAAGKTGDTSCSSEDEADGDENDPSQPIGFSSHEDDSEAEAQILGMSAQHINVGIDDHAVSSSWMHHWTETPTSQACVVPNSIATPLGPLWAEYQQEMPSTIKGFTTCEMGTDSWINGLDGLDMIRDDSTTPLCPKDNTLQVVAIEAQDHTYSRPTAGSESHAPSTNAESGVEKLYYADLDGIFEQCCPTTNAAHTGNAISTAQSALFPSNMNMLTPRPSVDAATTNNSTITTPLIDPRLSANPDEKSSTLRPMTEMPSHSVSMNFSCTTAQLGDIMSLLASAGLPVNMKIDTRNKDEQD